MPNCTRPRDGITTCIPSSTESKPTCFLLPAKATINRPRMAPSEPLAHPPGNATCSRKLCASCGDNFSRLSLPPHHAIQAVRSRAGYRQIQKEEAIEHRDFTHVQKWVEPR